MSNDVFIEGTKKTATIRSPWLVLLFGILTFGVYLIFWWYFINRELADLGRKRGTDQLGTNPGASTAAYTLGGIVLIPQIWTIVTTNQRIQRAQSITVGRSLNGWIALLLWVFTLGLGGTVYMQYELNRVWRAPGMRPVVEEQDVAHTGSAAGDTERLKKLGQLRDSGTLSNAEFLSEKARLSLGAPAD